MIANSPGLVWPRGIPRVCLAHQVYDLEGELARQGGRYDTITRRSLEALLPELPTTDVLVISGLTWVDSLLDHAHRLRLIQSTSAGIERFPLGELRRRGIRLASARGVNVNAVSDHGMALILALARKLREAATSQADREWRPMSSDPDAREQELEGKTLVIVGLGRIGNRLARLAQAFGMTVIGIKRSGAHPDDVPATIMPPGDMLTAVSAADFVVLTCPLTDETQNLVGPRFLDAMKSSAFLVNIARGGVVDEPALIDALSSRSIAGAALDCFVQEPLAADSPFWAMPNVIVTAHTAGETQQYERNLVRLLRHNIAAFETRGTMLNEVA